MRFKNQPIDGLEDCVERCVGTRWNYWDRPFDHRNLSVCDPLPKNATEYVPDYPPNFIAPLIENLIYEKTKEFVVFLYQQPDALVRVFEYIPVDERSES